jgi:glycosyltransferase involved in cell wall biosynthesis
MQNTTFTFEVLIHDDASTDATANIIEEYRKKYPDIIKPIYQKENQYRKGVMNTLTYQLPRAKGKYIAFCEGDDYWTDEYKLQKQIDFLEANPDYTLCCHRYHIYDVEDNRWEPEQGYYKELFSGNEEGISFNFEFNLNYWLTKLLTVVFRRDTIDSVDFSKYNYFRDTHLFYYILKKGDGYCMNFYGGVYNRHLNGIFSKRSDKAHIHYNVYKDLFVNNRRDKELKRLYQIVLLRKINADVLNPEIKLSDSLKIAIEPLLYGKDIKTTFQAVRRILRDRLWRIKNTFLK